MKTIFIVSRKADFSASRLMTEPALMSHGYICCGSYEVYDVTTSKECKYLGKWDASEVIQRIKQDENSYKIEEITSESKEKTISRFSDQPKIFYVSSRALYE